MEEKNNLSKKIQKINNLNEYENLLIITEKIIRQTLSNEINLLNFKSILNKFVDKIFKDVKGNEELFVTLISYIEGNNKFFAHSLNTAIFTTIFCISLDIDEDDRNTLISTALLHDIGKLKYHDKIQKKYILDNESIKDVEKSHPAWGKRLILYHLRLSKEMGELIANHHENLMGTGFPNGLKGSDLSLNDNILITSNLLERILQNINYAGIDQFEKTIGFMMSKYKNLFKPVISKVILSLFQIENENRKYKRFSIQKNGYLESQISKIQYPCELIDLSAGGAKISLERKLPSELIYKINTKLAKTLSIRNKSCRIIRENESVKDYEYGLEFYNPDETIIKSIEPILDDKATNQKMN
ncbi:HD domain-containing protein [Spirochaetota bacterium]